MLAVLHDLNLAAAFADRILVMHEARIAAEGRPSEVLSEALIRNVWGVDARVLGGRNEPPTLVVKYAAPEPATHLRAAE